MTLRKVTAIGAVSFVNMNRKERLFEEECGLRANLSTSTGRHEDIGDPRRPTIEKAKAPKDHDLFVKDAYGQNALALGTRMDDGRLRLVPP